MIFSYLLSCFSHIATYHHPMWAIHTIQPPLTSPAELREDYLLQHFRFGAIFAAHEGHLKWSDLENDEMQSFDKVMFVGL